MIINFNRAKKVAAGCLAMSSCAFILWMSQANGQAATTTNTPVTLVQSNDPAATTASTQDASNYNQNDQGNYANLDSAQIDDQGNLNVSGWHATNVSRNRQYHYIIAYDQTNNRELGRVNVTANPVARPDVQRVHNVYGANESGFKASFDLSQQIASLDQVQIISRYTGDAHGNGDAADYWFGPITVDRNNRANLDNVTVTNNQLVIAGWHATNLAANKPYHYVIVIDRTANGREVGRYLVKNSVSRPDVAKAFPGIGGARRSGFKATFSLANLNLTHQLQVVSRYSANATGNSNYVDYWFSPITNANEANQGHLDGYRLANGKELTVSGWHATNLAKLANNHFLILYDQTANRQVGQVLVSAVNRPDVAKACPAITMAGQAGFTGHFDLTKAQLFAGHTYAVVSRYSTSSQGNGSQGQYLDYWFTPFKLDQQGAWLDSVKMTANGLQVAGWMASDQSVNRPNAFVIVLNNGKEVARAKLNLVARPDVAKRLPQIYNSQNSGFSQLVKFKPNVINGIMQVLLRFAASQDGNSNYVDLLNQHYGSNDGAFDQISVSPNSIYVSGWYASDQSANKPYQWLIFVDQAGHELYRQQVLDVNNARSDLANNRAYILNAGQAGFKLGFNIPSQLQHQVVRIIHRITDDQAGNGNYVDFWSSPVDINAYAQRLVSRWQQIANSYAMPVSIAVQMADTGEIISFTNVPGQTFVTASTVKVGILEKLPHNQGGNLNAAQLATATKMIEVSDNDAATELYHEIGGMGGLNQLYRELGLTSTYCAGRWGLTTTTATDQLKILHEIFLNPNSAYLNKQGQQTIQYLMARVSPSQNWGISAGSSNFYIKDGWNTTDAWNVSSIGYIPGKYTIAVYTKNPSFDTCRNFIQGLATATRQIVG